MICDDCIHKIVCVKVYNDDWCAFKQTTETINAVIIPDNATNGDMIKAIFPETIIYDDIYVMHIGIGRADMNFRKDWWYAPYKRGENNE